jgi:SMC interacting uncharacterized protein involved in chromosome segregation
MSTAKDPYEALLERQLQGIRSTREELEKNVSSRAVYLDAEWRKMVESVRKLQTRLQRHPKVQHFVINKDDSEISIKILDAGMRRSYCFYILSRNHPEKKYPGMDVIWLCEFGEPDRNFREPSEALGELVRAIAPKLA